LRILDLSNSYDKVQFIIIAPQFDKSMNVVYNNISMKKRVLLYNGVSSAYGDPYNSTSFSLMAISAYLKEKKYKTNLIHDNMSDEKLRYYLRDALCVGFSVYTGNGIIHSLSMAGRIKKLKPKVSLVWGGYHPTLETKQTIEHEFVDYIIRGQGEVTFEQLLRQIENPKSVKLDKIEGLTYKNNLAVCSNPPRMQVDINSFPRFDFSLYNHYYKNSKDAPYISSRGCPFACKFCCSSAFNRIEGLRVAFYTVDRIISDVHYLIDRYPHIERVDFLDDNFLSNIERLKKFVGEYRKNNFTFKWTAFGRCDFFSHMDESLLRDLKDINLVKVFFGVESGSQRMLKRINKRIRVKDVIIAAKRVAKYEISADFTFINGFPKDRKSDIIKSIKLRNKLKQILPNSSIRFFVYVPLPATETMLEAVELGYKPPEKLEEWKMFEYHSYNAPWLSPDHQKFVNNIAWASVFDTFPHKLNGKYIFARPFFKLLKKDAEIRFKKAAFSFAPEFQLINTLYRNKLSV